MSNKTYHQYCAIAHTLDLVGERWTLLIVRNLLLGEKRFSDLMKGLPGISTNMLTERLKILEERGLITTRFLPPPAASTVYHLTESGYSLVEVLTTLARWGSQTLGEPQTGQVMVSEGIGFMVMGVFYRHELPTFALTCNVCVADAGYEQVFGVTLSPAGVTLSEIALVSSDVRLHIALTPLSTLSSGHITLQALLAEQKVMIEGIPSHIDTLITWVDGR